MPETPFCMAHNLVLLQVRGTAVSSSKHYEVTTRSTASEAAVMLRSQQTVKEIDASKFTQQRRESLVGSSMGDLGVPICVLTKNQAPKHH